MIARPFSASTRAVRSHGPVIDLLDARVPSWDRSQARILFEQQWIRNAAFFAGKQHFTMMGNQLVDVPLAEHEIRSKVNLIKPAVLRAVAKVINMQSKMGVAPSNPTPRAREIARTSERVREHQDNVVDYQAEKAHAALWACVTGTSFLWNQWDPSKGDLDRFYWVDKADRTVIPAAALAPEERARRDREGLFDDLAPGEVTCEATGPFTVYVDASAKRKLEHAKWIVDARYVDRALIAELFNVNEGDIPSDDGSSAALRYEEALAYMTTGVSGLGGVGSMPQIEFENRTWLRTMFERPSRAHKKGRYVVAAGSKVLRDMDNPYAGDRTGVLHLPVVKLAWIEMLNRFWGLSLVDDLTSPQFRYNESRSRMFELERVAGRPPIFVPKGSGIPVGEMAIKTGSVYEYTPQWGPPVFMAPAQLPPEVVQNAMTSAKEIRELSTGSELDGARMPGSLRSGSAVDAMQRDRDQVLDLTMQGVLRVDRDCGRQRLQLGHMFYDAPRLLRYRGPNGQWSVEQFKGADLSNDIQIFGEPGELETVQQRRSTLMEAVQIGALVPATNPQHAQIVLKALRFNTGEEAIDDFLMHEQAQEAEIREMLGNPAAFMEEPYPVMPWEDHAAHKRVLARYFHQDEWKTLTPELKSVLATHWQMHDQQEQAAIAQMLALQEQAKGAPAAKGQASQPSRQ